MQKGPLIWQLEKPQIFYLGFEDSQKKKTKIS